MTFCNLSETVHNKWLQMSGKPANNLFDATCDDSIRAWMQMTKYRAYFRGHAFGSGPSKGELKLRAVRRSRCPKKIAEALNSLSEAQSMGSHVPHLEGEEIFGSTKRRLDVPIGDAGDLHRPDKVNFSQTPCEDEVHKRNRGVIGGQWTTDRGRSPTVCDESIRK